MLSTYKPGTGVYNADDEKLGTIARIVIDPKTDEVTHIVVNRGFMFRIAKVVSTDLVEETSANGVTLSKEVPDLAALPDFEEIYYVDADDPAALEAASENRQAVFWYPPLLAQQAMVPTLYSLALPAQIEIKERNTPSGSVALKEAARVVSKDGQIIGKITRIYLHPETQQVMSFLISHGIFLKEAKVIPVEWVKVLTEDEIHLAVNSSIFERLPVFEPIH